MARARRKRRRRRRLRVGNGVGEEKKQGREKEEEEEEETETIAAASSESSNISSVLALALESFIESVVPSLAARFALSRRSHFVELDDVARAVGKSARLRALSGPFRVHCNRVKAGRCAVENGGP